MNRTFSRLDNIFNGALLVATSLLLIVANLTWSDGTDTASATPSTQLAAAAPTATPAR